MKESKVPEFLALLQALQYRRMGFEEFYATTLSVYLLKALDLWEQHAHCAYEIFKKDGNRVIMIEEPASEHRLGPSARFTPFFMIHTDGKLSFLGFVKLLHEVSSHSVAKVHWNL